MGSDNAFSELCPVCGTEMNDNWISEERVLICPKCSFYKEMASMFTQGGIASSAGSPILLDGYDSKETIMPITSLQPTYMDASRALLCMKACEGLTDELLESDGIRETFLSFSKMNGIKVWKEK